MVVEMKYRLNGREAVVMRGEGEDRQWFVTRYKQPSGLTGVATFHSTTLHRSLTESQRWARVWVTSGRAR